MLRIEKKKLISILFAILILVNNFVPIMVYAEASESENTTDTEEITTNYEIKEEEEWDISKNGDGSVKAKWILEDKSLTITGNGEMKDWIYSSNDDWHNGKYKDIINKVKIQSGVKNIGNNAFSGCSSLKIIEIPDSISDIGEDVFGKISIAGGTVVTGNETTNEKTDSNESENTNSVNYSNNVTYIDSFDECRSLESINVDINNEYYSSIDGILFNNDKTKLIKYPANKTNVVYTIPNNVTNIEQGAFKNCCNLENIVIPNSISRIEKNIFVLCKKLKKIEIPDSVTYIDKNTFNGANSLESIVVDTDNENYTSIDDVLYSKDKTKIIKYPANKKDTTYIIPNEVTYVVEHAFENCSKLDSIIIPKSVKDIEENAFFGYISPLRYCYSNSYAHKYFEDREAPYLIIDEENSDISTRYEIKKEEEWDISKNGDNSVIAKWTFNDRKITVSGRGQMKDWNFQPIDMIFCSRRPNIKYLCLVNKLEIQEGITNIGKQAFRDCYNLKTIEISSTIQNIEEDALIGCNNLECINVNKDNNNYVSIDGILYNKDQTKIVNYPFKRSDSNFIIPDGVTEISFKTFNNISLFAILTDNVNNIYGNLKNITIPSSLTNIEKRIFCNMTSLENINVDTNNKNYSSIDGVLYNKDKTEIIAYPPNKVNNNYIILENVKKIGDYAFEGCIQLKRMMIPENVMNIDDKAFEGWNGILICKRDSQAHRYAEANKKRYILDNLPPQINVSYTATNLTNKDVTVTITTDEEIQEVTGWELSTDKKTLTKTYSKNTTEEITVKDLVGNETKQQITINNIVQINADINGDGKINTGDVTSLLRHIAQEKDANIASKHTTWKFSEEKKISGDLNQNGKIDTGDVIKLQRYLAAKSSQEIANKHPEWLDI